MISEQAKESNVEAILTHLWASHLAGNRGESVRLINTLTDLVKGPTTFRSCMSQVEFFLPQLANLIIHMDSERDVVKASESIILAASDALVAEICARSLTTALDLKLILLSSLEDCLPELGGGARNPSYNARLHSRCTKLISIIDRIVVFGDLHVQSNTLLDSTCNNVSSSRPAIPDLSALMDKARSYSSTTLSGFLYYKRVDRKSIIRAKPWKVRFFEVKDRTLNCHYYANSDTDWEKDTPSDTTKLLAGNLLRSLSLQTCTLKILPRGTIINKNDLNDVEEHGNQPPTPDDKNTNNNYTIKYDYQFELYNRLNNAKLQLRASSKESFDEWIRVLKQEIGIDDIPSDITGFWATSAGGVGSPQSDISVNDISVSTGLDNMAAPTVSPPSNSSSPIPNTMTQTQAKKYHIFRNQLLFVRMLADIAEKMRFVDRSIRKPLLKIFSRDLNVPYLAYLPTSQTFSSCFQPILRAIPDESYPFNTKQRCPCLFMFEMENHPQGLDANSFIDSDICKDNYTLSEIMTLTNCRGSVDYKTLQSSRFKVLSSESMKQTLKEDIGTDEGGNTMRPLINHEHFSSKFARLKKDSMLESGIPSWGINGLIAKSNDDVRQEVFVMQLISYLKGVFSEKGCTAWLHTYKILGISKSAGLIELISDAISLDALKKQEGWPGGLRSYFNDVYGHDPVRKHKCICNFVNSLAGYSIVSYLLAIKDRHNGNIMIDVEGHLIHIDFGFVFGLAPGKAFSMERAPFKLTQEYVDLMGGLESEYFKLFKEACTKALSAARSSVGNICILMEIMGFQSNYPAFLYNSRAIPQLRSRFKENLTEAELAEYVESMISESLNNWGTIAYDKFQVATNGYAE